MPRILSLDTKPEILELLHTVIQRAGYEHMYATSNEQALDTLRQGNIDLFTQNIMRFGTNGCEFYQSTQNSPDLKDIPVLIISSLDPIALPDACFAMIANLYPHHYVAMPFSPKKLRAVIKNELANKIAMSFPEAL